MLYYHEPNCTISYFHLSKCNQRDMQPCTYHFNGLINNFNETNQPVPPSMEHGKQCRAASPLSPSTFTLSKHFRSKLVRLQRRRQGPSDEKENKIFIYNTLHLHTICLLHAVPPRTIENTYKLRHTTQTPSNTHFLYLRLPFLLTASTYIDVRLSRFPINA